MPGTFRSWVHGGKPIDTLPPLTELPAWQERKTELLRETNYLRVIKQTIPNSICSMEGKNRVE